MRLAQRLREIHELPTLPEIVLKIRNLVLSDDGNAASLARIIERDPSLCAKILKVANSSFYGGTAGPITSVQLSVARIGFNEIGNIAMAVSLIKKFPRRSTLLDYWAFWRHCLAAAYLAPAAADDLPLRDAGGPPPDFFLAGLLHDIGIILYDQFFHEEFEKINVCAAEKKLAYVEAEAAIAPEDSHAALGSALLELWNIDLPVVHAVRYHHDCSAAPPGNERVAHAVDLSETLLRAAIEGSFEGYAAISEDGLRSRFGVKPDAAPELFQKAARAYEHTDELFIIGY